MTIIENLKKLYSSVVRKPTTVNEDVASVFRFKYSLFKELLAANTELLNIITDIEEKLQGRQLFGMSYIRSQTTRAVFYSFRMVKSLNVLSGNRLSRVIQSFRKNPHARSGRSSGRKRSMMPRR